METPEEFAKRYWNSLAPHYSEHRKILAYFIAEHDAEIRKECVPDLLALLKRCKQALAASGKDCPYCPNQGWYAVELTDEPEQVQCEFCYTVPNSVFNINALLSDIAKAEVRNDAN